MMSHDTALFGLTPAPARGASLMQRLRGSLGLLLQGRGREPRDAAALRAMASRLQEREPALASDLLAAADRHEQQFETSR